MNGKNQCENRIEKFQVKKWLNENEWQNPINQNKRQNHKYIDKTIIYVVFYNIPPPIQKKADVEWKNNRKLTQTNSINIIKE